VPCLLANSQTEVAAKCPHLSSSSSNACPPENPDCCLDSCYVCGGQNAKFVGMHLVNESGVCNHAGSQCQEGTEPTVCGICDIPAHKQNRQVNAGICDCFDGGTPNGGKVLDRCSICDGKNASMDYCGHNGDIPARFVCHPDGPDGNEKWNASCSGCDGEPRPDLPWENVGSRWNVAPASSPDVCTIVNSLWGRGGLQCDACGICGGDSSTCTGCDGVAGSGKVLDECKICDGDDSACRGCDNVARYMPTQLDGCGDCGAAVPVFSSCNSISTPKYFCNTTDYQPHFIDETGKDMVLTRQINSEIYEENKELCKQGCDGVSSSLKLYNKCGTCGGDNANCLPPCCENAADILHSQGKLSNVPGCVDPQPSNWKDLNLVPNTPDNCWSRYVWGMNTLQCEFGVYVDPCGRCGGDGSTCKGCDGQPFSGRVKDLCGTCDGDGSSCVGCDGIVNSGKMKDACGVCDGDGSSCVG